jgi:hypothetical protein
MSNSSISLQQPEWLMHSVLHPSSTVLSAVSAPWSGKATGKSSSAPVPVAMATVSSDGHVCVLSAELSASMSEQSHQIDAEFGSKAIDIRSDFTCAAFDSANRDLLLLGCADGTAHVVRIASNGNFFEKKFFFFSFF